MARREGAMRGAPTGAGGEEFTGGGEWCTASLRREALRISHWALRGGKLCCTSKMARLWLSILSIF
jgi:hypothetical protein